MVSIESENNTKRPGASCASNIRRIGTHNGKKAGYLRNCQMAENADALVAFWDGNSPRTRHMIETARAHGLAVRAIRIKTEKKENLYDT